MLAPDYNKAEFFYWVGLSYENVQKDVLACEAYARCHFFALEHDQPDTEQTCFDAQQALSCSTLNDTGALTYSPEYMEFDRVESR